MLLIFGLAEDGTNRVITSITHEFIRQRSFRGWMISVEMSASLRILNDFKHVLLNSKGTSLTKILVRGLAICEKSFINLQWKLAWPRKLLIHLTFTGEGSCSITSILALSTVIWMDWDLVISRISIKKIKERVVR